MSDPIRLPQVRVLNVLTKLGPLSRNKICEKTGVTIGPVNNAIGEAGEASRKAADARKGYLSLLTRKMVKFTEGEENGKPCTAYEITAAGTKALEASLKDLGKIPPVNHNEGHKPYSNGKNGIPVAAPAKKAPKKVKKPVKEEVV